MYSSDHIRRVAKISVKLRALAIISAMHLPDFSHAPADVQSSQGTPFFLMISIVARALSGSSTRLTSPSLVMRRRRGAALISGRLLQQCSDARLEPVLLHDVGAHATAADGERLQLAGADILLHRFVGDA